MKIVFFSCEKPRPFNDFNTQERVNVENLLEVIKETGLNEGEDYKVIYTGQDIYSPGLNYVFGKTYARDRICIISSRRLQDALDINRSVERLVKVTIHEIGHLLRLSHCEDPGCAMYRSNDEVSVDRRAVSFCKECAENIDIL